MKQSCHRWWQNCRRFSRGLSQAWAGLMMAILLIADRPAAAYQVTDVPVIANAYSNAFYYTSGTNGYWRTSQTDSSPTYFWQSANEIQSVEDAYQWTGNAAYLRMATNLLNGFLTYNGANWAYNGYNDDDLWAVMAFALGAQLTGNAKYAAVAKANFDLVYARAWDTNLGGGLYWLYPNNASKNACVNGPGAIAAALLYQFYGDTNYWNKATNIYYWERAVLYSAGRIADNIGTNGQVNGGPTTYNQGTFLGAADLLGQTNDALVTASYTMNSMSGAGFLPQYGIAGNNSIFNSIFIRWMGRFMKNRSLTAPYQGWLQNQANAAWNGRRTADNLSWCQSPQPTPDGTVFYSYDCISSYEAMLAVPPTQTNVTSAVTLNASDVMGSSSFESGLNWADGNAPSVAHDYIVNGLTLRTPADAASHFFAGNSLTLSNSAVLGCKNTSGGLGINVGTDLFLDNGEIDDWSGNSTTFYGHVTLRAGGGGLDPQGNTFTITALMGGPGFLQVKATSLALTRGTLIISGLNTYTGGTLINAAQTVKLSGEGTLGSSGGSLTFNNSAGFGYGTVDLNALNLAIGNLSGAGGQITNSSTNTVIFTIGTSNATGGVFQGTISGNLQLVKTGTGNLALAALNPFTGGVSLTAGTLMIGNDSALGTGLLDFNGGTTGATIQSMNGTAHTITTPINFDGGAGANTIFGGSGNLKFTGPCTNGTAKTWTVNNPQTELSGVLSGASARTVAGTGVLILSGANTYSQGTTINAGATLQLGNGGASGSLSASGVIDTEGTLAFDRSDVVIQGTHFSSAPIIGAGAVVQAGAGTVILNAANTYTGTTTVNQGALLVNGSLASRAITVNANGTLGGTGVLSGTVTVSTGGILAPGIWASGALTNVIGTLRASGAASISGAVMMKINRGALPNSDDFTAPSITVNSGATLTVTNLGSTNFVAGDQFTLFNPPINGAFGAVYLPSLPGTALTWTNGLALNGTIAVVPVTVINTNSPNLAAGVNGGTLTLSWPLDHLGWMLQAQTNSLEAGLGTNWADVLGSTVTNVVTIPMIGNGAVFYRLKL